jgi:hypothetical protein
MRTPVVAVAAIAVLAAAIPAAAQNLEPLTQRMTLSWGRGDVGAITSLIAADGVAIEIEGQRVGPLNARQASAVLRRLFDNREIVSAQTGMAKIVSGSPRRAFVELAWTIRARGTTIPERYKIFLALVNDDRDAWRITEIRLLK